MKLLIHDYAGHEFPVHLAKELKRRGHEVSHSYCASNVTPHADFSSALQSGVTLLPIHLGRRFEKHRPLRRLFDEIDYGIRSTRLLRREQPHQLIAAQVPVISLLIIQFAAARLGIPVLLWLQDIQADIAKSQSKGIGSFLAAFERRAVRNADIVVTISDEMADTARSMNASAEVRVIENWADPDKIKPGEKANSWSIGHGIDHTFNFVYSGTLGIKHRPEALVHLAHAMQLHGNVRIVVVSQGAGTEKLAQQLRERELHNVILLPLQPAELLPDVLASADVMVALLEADAASGCVPSKILAYLAAGRPTLALFPASNLASRIINDRSRSGLAVETVRELTDAANELRRSPEIREAMSFNARRYAERTFDIETIANQFEDLLRQDQGEIHVRAQ